MVVLAWLLGFSGLWRFTEWPAGEPEMDWGVSKSPREAGKTCMGVPQASWEVPERCRGRAWEAWRGPEACGEFPKSSPVLPEMWLGTPKSALEAPRRSGSFAEVRSWGSRSH